jgi:signal transduction histidine kinase
LWRGLLIVLPALAMAGFGFVSLRNDRILVRHQAAEEAKRLATDLVESILPAALTIDLRLPGTGGFRPHEDPILAASREGIIAWLADASGAIRYPPWIRMPEPEPLEDHHLDPAMRKAWVAARSKLFANEDGAAASLLSFLDTRPPGRWEALTVYYLFDLELRDGRLDEAADYLERIRQRHGPVKTESGQSLRLLAEWRWVRMADGAPVAAQTAEWDWVCRQATMEPGPLSPVILEGARAFVGRHPGAVNIKAWADLWDAHQRARSFAGVLNGFSNSHFGGRSAPVLGRSNTGHAPIVQHLTGVADVSGIAVAGDGHTPVQSENRRSGLDEAGRNHDARGWIRHEELDYLILRQTEGGNVWRLAWSEEALRSQVTRALSMLSVPSHLGCGIVVDGRTLSSVETGDAPLASHVSGPRELGGPEMTADIWLTDPAVLYARQRKRTWVFGTLIAVSAASVMCGVTAAWRGFKEQQRLTEMKSNFVSSVSHEMRAPIAAVRLMAEELVDQTPADPVKAGEYHGYILQECRRLSGLIENVLDFSRHEQGRKQYRFEPTHLGAVVDETLHLMRGYAVDRGVTLERRFEGEPREVAVDASAMRQVLVNLIDNAIKHSPAGAGVEVALQYPPRAATAALPDGGSPALNGALPVRLSVRDEGPGIPANEQRLIFQRFYRRGSELRRETQGIGLGLAIVQYITEAHGGKVRVESEVGKGSRFIVELPSHGGTAHA